MSSSAAAPTTPTTITKPAAKHPASARPRAPPGHVYACHIPTCTWARALRGEVSRHYSVTGPHADLNLRGRGPELVVVVTIEEARRMKSEGKGPGWPQQRQGDGEGEDEEEEEEEEGEGEGEEGEEPVEEWLEGPYKFVSQVRKEEEAAEAQAEAEAAAARDEEVETRLLQVGEWLRQQQ